MLDARITLLDDDLGMDLTLSDRFQAAGRANEPNPIYLLRHIARYQYSPERQAVYTILKERFDAEADRGESSARQTMEDFRRGPTGEEVGPRRLTASCHWDEDGARGVIALIRCFGPNADGKYGQDISRGSYNDYLSFLPKIADCLMEYAGGNPEAMLVCARFPRETYSANQRAGLPNSKNFLLEAKNELRAAIEQHDQQNLQQYDRLAVEVCRPGRLHAPQLTRYPLAADSLRRGRLIMRRRNRRAS